MHCEIKIIELGRVPQTNWHPNWRYKPDSIFGVVGQVHCEIVMKLSLHA